MGTNIDKAKLTEIIDSLHLQITWVWMCIDALEALNAIPEKKLNVAKNFIYITRSSLVYRYSMELSKLVDTQKGLSIFRIKNLCSQNHTYFDDSFNVIEYCRNFDKEIKQYSDLIKNLKGRRHKTYGHNDEEYYLFNQKAIADFPLDMCKIKVFSKLIFDFATTMQQHVGSKRKDLYYPANSDDVKRLFGEKRMMIFG